VFIVLRIRVTPPESIDIGIIITIHQSASTVLQVSLTV